LFIHHEGVDRESIGHIDAMASSQSDIEETKGTRTTEHVDVPGLKEKDNGDILANPDVMHEAFDGEAREHEMGLWEAVKSYPTACFWAFVMCFTIVSCPAFSPLIAKCVRSPMPRMGGEGEACLCKACVHGTNLG
jgi:hypothetical protein